MAVKEVRVIQNQLQIELMDRVTSAMEEKGWSQGELSRRSGVSQPNISHLVTGDRAGTLTTWNKLLQALEAVA